MEEWPRKGGKGDGEWREEWPQKGAKGTKRGSGDFTNFVLVRAKLEFSGLG
jgi:hypothetical protein